ncbi:MAG: hypothetical protein JKY66_04045 [Spongiibacteraceae bacterium]|nr:hypothetical protein [Spongiibacteraceae bacterium]
MRDRFTQADREAQAVADAFIIKGESKRIRRKLERPLGSVRWKVETPDTHQDDLPYMAP